MKNARKTSTQNHATPVAKEMTLNFKAYRSQTVPNRKRMANKNACRGNRSE